MTALVNGAATNRNLFLFVDKTMLFVVNRMTENKYPTNITNDPRVIIADCIAAAVRISQDSSSCNMALRFSHS